MRPIVAVSATSRTSDGMERVFLNRAYVTALELTRMIPVIIPPLEDSSAVQEILRTVHGLLLSGGEDVDPASYGASRHPATGDSHAARDACEIELARTAQEMAIPTLAICRGFQVLNVALGGSLLQDIPSLVEDAESHDTDGLRTDRVHRVSVAPGSRLADVLGAEEISVNSTHHQALERVADDLRVSARATDGIIEGVESCNADWFALGVQWHPEELTRSSEAWDRRIFEAFASACRERAALPAVTSEAR